jgi:magnesium and cobalt transporter
VPRRRRRNAQSSNLARAGKARGVADLQEQHILAALDDLRDATVSEVMTPRVDVVALPIPVHAADVARAVRESGHSCFPVYDDDIDNLVGVLYVNDLFRAGWAIDTRSSGAAGAAGASASSGSNGAEGSRSNGGSDERPSPIDISRRLRQPYLVPESHLVLDVLGEMRRVKRTFAVVADEYGGVEGVVTVKDLLAALVGDLYDEFDGGGEPEVVRVDRNRWLVDGGASIDDVRTHLGLALPEGKYVTLGGYIFDALGHIPSEGERLRYGDWELRVVEMDRRRVAKVVAVQPTSAGAAGAGG